MFNHVTNAQRLQDLLCVFLDAFSGALVLQPYRVYSEIYGELIATSLNRHATLTQSCFNVGPASTTLV